MKYEQINIDLLIPYVNNAKKHSDEQITKVASSIKEFGFLNPILIDKDNGIIAGHCRAYAAKKLGLKEVPCIRIEHLSETQKKAYILADNRLAELGEWDEDLLRLEIEELKLNDFNIDTFGFNGDELKLLLPEPETGAADNIYTRKVEIPIYKPKREDKPTLQEIINLDKFNQLSKEIEENKEIEEQDKIILKLAAHRHVKFNYKNIAEYYCHSDKNTQELMEKSALVIIDFNKAIENGFVEITDDIANQFSQEGENDES